jgi:DNA repair protein RadC
MITETNPSLPIKKWAEHERPREKMILKGLISLSDAELIAILISSGTKNESAVDLAKSILSLTQNNLTSLARLSASDLQQVKGIGPAKALRVVAALELGRRRKQEMPVLKQKISSSADSFRVFEPLLTDLVHEELWVLLLNRAHKIIGYKKLSEGGVSGTFVDPKIIFKYAVENLASSIILCHNHPSGNLEPSEADKQLTRNLKKAADLFQITIVDHLIIGDARYYSFSDSGIL